MGIKQGDLLSLTRCCSSAEANPQWRNKRKKRRGEKKNTKPKDQPTNNNKSKQTKKTTLPTPPNTRTHTGHARLLSSHCIHCIPNVLVLTSESSFHHGRNCASMCLPGHLVSFFHKHMVHLLTFKTRHSL